MCKDLYKHHIIESPRKPSEVTLASLTHWDIGLREVTYPAAATELWVAESRSELRPAAPKLPGFSDTPFCHLAWETMQ